MELVYTIADDIQFFGRHSGHFKLVANMTIRCAADLCFKVLLPLAEWNHNIWVTAQIDQKWRVALR